MAKRVAHSEGYTKSQGKGYIQDSDSLLLSGQGLSPEMAALMTSLGCADRSEGVRIAQW